MKIELKKFGEILISRPAGREAFLVIAAYFIKDLDKNTEIEIDFEGVKVLAPSWADEVITKLAEKFKNVKLLNTENVTVQATLKILKEYSNLKLNF
ncbi:MAG: STAS-like domain-containing protein [Candidatus Kuenenbacteria bacterium]